MSDNPSPFTPEFITAAVNSDQTEFDQPLADDLGVVLFVTAVPDAPLQCLGQLNSRGQWRVPTADVPPLGRSTAEVEDNMLEVLSLCVVQAQSNVGVVILRGSERVTDPMIRERIAKLPDGKLDGPGARGMADAFLTRLALPCNARFR